MKQLKLSSRFFLFVFLTTLFLWNGLQKAYSKDLLNSAQPGEKRISESWMGIYISGIKVGYSHSLQLSLTKNGKKYKKDRSESWMRVSRLGGNPVEVRTIQESLSDEQGRPLACVLRTKMAESETVTEAEVVPDRIVFRSQGKVIKELSYEEEFYFGTPLKKILEEGGLKPGKKYSFKVLEPLTYSLVDCRFEVLAEEEVLILGNKMKLWHVREELASILPITMEEWIDDRGDCWKAEAQASFFVTTSIRMPKEKALEISDENFDIALSTVITSNVTFEKPQEVQGVTYKLSGISPEKIKNFPFDDGSQKLVETGKDYVILQTRSQVFKEDDAIPFPVKEEGFREYLKPTSFCQADDPEIQKVAKEIVGEEKNSWRAAKKIAEWVREEMTPNYDVGFATAKEILKNREGDCSEHTVITVTLCRVVGIPSRAAVGIMYAYGLFAYHMWPEVYVGRWIGLDAKWLAVDKKSGEYYTDATHLKFGRSGLDENIFKEMVQSISEIVGKLKLEILEYHLDK